MKTKLRRAGASLVATLPKSVVERLHLEEGDELLVRDTPDGVLLEPVTEHKARVTAALHQVIRENRELLRTLKDL